MLQFGFSQGWRVPRGAKSIETFEHWNGPDEESSNLRPGRVSHLLPSEAQERIKGDRPVRATGNPRLESGHGQKSENTDREYPFS
ncbi:MAG: hypothetical protein LIP28_03805 [Deltaproteobacteria bacterium]|nr:hypothetical protein [Deltaproteobacteria bacterium]